MQIKHLFYIVLGIVYLIWSIYSIKDIISTYKNFSKISLYVNNFYTIFWLAINLSIILTFIFMGLGYIIDNYWETTIF